MTTPVGHGWGRNGEGPRLPPVELATHLRAIAGSGDCLLVDPDGPEARLRVEKPQPRTKPYLWRQEWTASAAGEAVTGPHYDLIVCDERRVVRADPEIAELCGWLCERSNQVAVVTADGPALAGLMPQPAWAAALAARGFHRAFPAGVELIPAGVGIYRKGEAASAKISAAYEQALDRLAVSVREGGVRSLDAGSEDSLHRALIERDRTLGLMARTLTLQYEVDLWRTTAAEEATRTARAGRQLAELKASARYRLGSKVLGPMQAARRGRKGSGEPKAIDQ